jgi:hypothetical protein
MNLAELFGNASEQIASAIKRGLATQDRSHRHNPHHRIHTKKYADGRQTRGRAHFLSKRVGANFVQPQPSEKALQRKNGAHGPTPGTKTYKRWLKRGGKHAADVGETVG